MPKDVVTYIDTASEPFIRQVLAQSRAWNAHLALTAMTPIPAADLTAAGGFPAGFYPAGFYENVIVELERTAAKRAAKIRSILDGAYGFELREISGESGALPRLAAAQARYADLALFGPATAYASEWLRHDTIEAVLFGSGRPALIVPKTWSPKPSWERVTIGWNATRESSRALHDVLPWLASNTQIDVVVVDPSPSPASHGSNAGDDIAAYLARQGHQPEVYRIGSAGASIADRLRRFAHEREADLLVLGAYSHSRFRETILGGVTRSILAGCDVPILLSH